MAKIFATTTKTLNVDFSDGVILNNLHIQDSTNANNIITLKINNLPTTTLRIGANSGIDISFSDGVLLNTIYISTDRTNAFYLLAYSEIPTSSTSTNLLPENFEYIPTLIYIIGGLVLFGVILLFIDFLRRTIR